MAKHGKKTATQQRPREVCLPGATDAPVRPMVKRKWLLATLAVAYTAWLGLLVTLSLTG